MRILVILWLAAILGGFAYLSRFQGKPGEVAEIELTWPESSALTRRDDRLNLVVFMHPRCPCSRASARELERIMVRLRDRVSVQVVFVQPEAVGSDWSDTNLVALARAIPAAAVRIDVDGREAERFGALTSGHAYLYAADGNLLFSGGITSSRAHEGDNLGSLAILSLGMGRDPHKVRTPVYGCSLIDEEVKPL